MRLSLKYSSSVTSSITTTLPSAGQIIFPSLMVKVRAGMRKKDTKNRKSANVRKNISKATLGKESLSNEKLARFSTPKIRAAIAIDIYPSRCIFMVTN